jgi:hypothetical protein
MKRIAEVAGSNVVLRRWNKGRKRQQTFRFDISSKTIKSQYHKSYSLDIPNNGRSSNLRVTTTNSRWWQMFRLKGTFITNERGKVMDVSGNRDKENQNIIVWKKHGGLNQQWDIVYADSWKGEPTKGQLNREYGLYVQRTFYIQT